MAKPTRRSPDDKKPDKQGLLKGDIVRGIRQVNNPGILRWYFHPVPFDVPLKVVKLVDISDERGLPLIHVSDPATGNLYTGSYNRGFQQDWFQKDHFMSAVAQRGIEKKKGLKRKEADDD